jgi:cysteine desulfurase family protein
VENLIYLDNAATAWPKPDSVYNFMVDFYRRCGVNPGRSGFDLAIEAGNIVEDLRKRLTKFFGGDTDAPERLCFAHNATDALNLVIWGVLCPGDHVVTTNLEHNSVIRPINHLVRDQAVEVTYVPFNPNGFVEPDDIKAAIKKNTRLVAVNHGSNVLGTVQPLKEIGRVCKDRGVLFVVDSSQTAGVVPINMIEMNIDALAFTGHKALMGCTGIGGLCVRKGVEIRQTRAGGTGVDSVYPFHLERYPYRMEYGTPNMVGIAALWAGQEWIEQIGIENIHAQEMRLARRLVAGFKEIEGVRVYCCDSLENHLSTVAMNIEGMDAANVGTWLDVDFNVATRTGLHCAPLVHKQIGTLEIKGAVRFSIGAFNTDEHITHALGAVAEIASWVHEQKVKA